MRKIRSIVVAVLLGLALVPWGVYSTVAAAEAPRMSTDELKGMLDSKGFALIDVRAGKDWDASEIKIKGAVREDPKALDSWVAKYPKDKTLVLYCAWKNEGTSAGLAQKLIEKGYTKVYALKGGWHEWHRAQYPVENKWYRYPRVMLERMARAWEQVQDQ